MTCLFFDNASTVPAIFLFTIAIGFLDGWSSPARSAMIPRLVEKKQLLKANSFLTMVDRTTELGGWPLGAILVVAIGADHLIWLTVLLYLFAAFVTTRIENKQTKREVFTESRRSFLSRSLAGWRFILNKPYLRAISVADVLENSANVVWIAAILYVYVDEVLGTGEEWWGYINASFFGGLLIGGMLGYRYASFMEKQISRLIHVGTFAVFLTTLAFSLISTPWVALLFSTLFGFSSQLKGVALQTIVQTNVPEKELARVYSAQEAAGFASFGLSTILFGFLTDLLGARFIFALAAAILLISALYLFVVRKELYLHQVVQTEEPIEKREST
ncbi:MFS transporter [Shouchella clausii]|uniref:MFS transporter n=1 Tax=Shouchella clausii TaxID=79880 RepID=UPI003461EBB4